MIRVLISKGAKLLDSHMIYDAELPSMVLMENAAAAVCSQLSNIEGRIVVLCGQGNNGGDGLAVARKLFVDGKDVAAVLFGATNTNDARLNLSIAKKLGVPIEFINTADELQRIFDQKPAAIVDALFGIGLSRDIGGIYAEAIESANNCTAIKIAVDIPSGINADTGAVMGAAMMKS
jgi:hydroxyethylthiazole kinase-like uncharacterized protein yjeF